MVTTWMRGRLRSGTAGRSRISTSCPNGTKNRVSRWLEDLSSRPRIRYDTRGLIDSQYLGDVVLGQVALVDQCNDGRRELGERESFVAFDSG